jgi:predicted site-specific integrase-resolvase
MTKSKPVTPKRRAVKTRPVPVRAGFSPAEFCERYGISRKTFERWRRLGLGPAEVQLIPGGRIFISEQAEKDWLAKRTAMAAVASATG